MFGGKVNNSTNINYNKVSYQLNQKQDDGLDLIRDALDDRDHHIAASNVSDNGEVQKAKLRVGLNDMNGCIEIEGDNIDNSKEDTFSKAFIHILKKQEGKIDGLKCIEEHGKIVAIEVRDQSVFLELLDKYRTYLDELKAQPIEVEPSYLHLDERRVEKAEKRVERRLNNNINQWIGDVAISQWFDDLLTGYLAKDIIIADEDAVLCIKGNVQGNLLVMGKSKFNKKSFFTFYKAFFNFLKVKEDTIGGIELIRTEPKMVSVRVLDIDGVWRSGFEDCGSKIIGLQARDKDALESLISQYVTYGQNSSSLSRK